MLEVKLKKKIKIFYYENNNKQQILEKNSFGFDIIRKETIKVKEDSYLLYLNYHENYYKNIIIEKRKINRNESYFLITNFFIKIKKSIFENNYLNFFIKENFTKKQKIFLENDLFEYIYFIKSGEIEISTKKSIIEIEQLLILLNKKLNNYNINNNIKSLKEEFLKKKLKTLTILKQNELMGILCFYFNLNFHIYNAICISESAIIYKISKKNLDLIIKTEKIENKLNNFINNKIKVVYDIFHNNNKINIKLADEKENYNKKYLAEKYENDNNKNKTINNNDKHIMKFKKLNINKFRIIKNFSEKKIISNILNFNNNNNNNDNKKNKINNNIKFNNFINIDNYYNRHKRNKFKSTCNSNLYITSINNNINNNSNNNNNSIENQLLKKIKNEIYSFNNDFYNSFNHLHNNSSTKFITILDNNNFNNTQIESQTFKKEINNNNNNNNLISYEKINNNELHKSNSVKIFGKKLNFPFISTSNFKLEKYKKFNNNKILINNNIINNSIKNNKFSFIKINEELNDIEINKKREQLKRSYRNFKFNYFFNLKKKEYTKIKLDNLKRKLIKNSFD